MADEHRRLGHVHPSAARRVRSHRHATARSRRSSDALPIDVFIVASRRSEGADARVRAHHRLRGAAAAVVVRLHAVASHAGGPGRDRMGGADVPREAAAVRRVDLSRHRVHAVWLEHAQRRVRLEGGELSRSEAVHRRRARAALQGGAARRDRRPAHERRRVRSVHARPGGAERPHAGRQVARGSRGAVLLAVPQAAVRPRHRRHVARPGRRPRRAVAPGAHSHVLGRPAAVSARTSVPSRCIATARPACSAMARSSGRATSTRSGKR